MIQPDQKTKAEMAIQKILARRQKPTPPGLRYGSAMEFFLAEGIHFANVQVYTSEQIRFHRDPYKRAAEMVLNAPWRYVYCEGVTVEGNGLTIPCTRPWLWDREKQTALDTSGGRLADEYFGVPFRFEWLRSQVLNRGVLGVFDSPKLFSLEPGDYWEERLERLPEAAR